MKSILTLQIGWLKSNSILDVIYLGVIARKNALEEKYNDELQDFGDEVRLREGSMNKLIKKGTKKHFYSFFNQVKQ